MDVSVQGNQLTQEILHDENVSLDSKNEIISHSDNYSHTEVESHVEMKSNLEIESCDTGSSVGDKSSKKKKRAKKNDDKIEENIKVTEPCTTNILKGIKDDIQSSVGVKSGNKKKDVKKNNDRNDKNIKTNLDGDVIMINEIPPVEMESSTSITKNIKASDVNLSNISDKNMQYHKENKIDRNEGNKTTDTNVPFNSVDHHGTMNDAYIAQKNKLNDLLKKPRSSWTPTHQNYSY
jgi:hypothetical protein